MTDPKPSKSEDDSPRLQSSSWSRKPPSLANALTPRPDYMQSRQEREAERNERRRILAAQSYSEAATHAADFNRGPLAELLRTPGQHEEDRAKSSAEVEKSTRQNKGQEKEKGEKSSEKGETTESR
ncbi:hypothetical protein LTR95_016808 [Oleoguttula sp. CCFEE 5521]